MATEVAVMSLSAHEQQALESIGDELTVSDPELASLLTTFTRLTAGEDMPVRDQTRTRARWASCSPGRHRRQRLRDQVGQAAGRSQRLLFWQGATLVFGILFAMAVVVGALAISGLRSGW
jgi:Protein of unknown function (DUF3040)